MDDSIPLRHCNKCGNDYPLTAEYFQARKDRNPPFRYDCKQCDNARQKIIRQELTPEARTDMVVYHKRYYQAHREQAIEDSRQYRETHKEQIVAFRKRSYQVHKEQNTRHNKQWYASHKEQASENNKQWYKAHREHRRIISHKRRAHKRGNGGTYTAQQIQEQYKRQKGKCYYCHHKVKWGKHHVDHIVPLSRGGSNDISNLVISCPSCNLKKHNKLPHEFPEGNRLL